MPPLDILLLGGAECPEFEWPLQQMEAVSKVVSVRGVDAALDYLRESARPPDLIVVAQAFPAAFSHSQLNALHRAAPLSRVVALLGSWCEGESRTGDPWPAAIRVYWYRWPAFFADELSRMYAAEPPSWSLPLTASDEERSLLAAAQPLVQTAGLIAVAAHDSQTAGWLADACSTRGYATVWLTSRRTPLVTGVAAVVADLPHFLRRDRDRLAGLARQFHPAPVVALLNNPRVEEWKQAWEAGAGAVVAKPLELTDLYWALDHVTSGSPASSTSPAPVTWQRKISRRQAAS